MKHYTYFLLLIFTLSYPIIRSFESKVHYHKKWKQLFPAILISAIIFIAGDVWFVNKGIWWFNADYITGIYCFNLPIEECLFFFIVPFSSMFIYEVINYFIKKDVLAKQCKYISALLILFLLSIAIIYHDRFYTLIIFVMLSIFLFVLQFIVKANYLSRYYLLWTILIVPFLLFDGIVTGMPITVYNDAQSLGIRIIYIPLEDLFYGMLQILLVLTLYDFFKKKFH